VIVDRMGKKYGSKKTSVQRYEGDLGRNRGREMTIGWPNETNTKGRKEIKGIKEINKRIKEGEGLGYTAQ
jgi:hypothetical protein